MVKITGHIDYLTEHEFDQLRAAGPGTRYEVVLDYTDGDHHELEAHFRLVELTATRPLIEPEQISAAEVVVTAWRGGKPEYRTKSGRLLTEGEMAYLVAAERERYPLREAHFGGLGGRGPVVTSQVHDRPGDLLASRLANILGELISLCRISPRILGIPDGPGPLGERIYLYLTGGEQAMGKHGDGKAADSKESKGGGKHESKGK